MKIQTPEISWHACERVLSVDFHSSGRLATCGQDCFLRIWKIEDARPDCLFEKNEKSIINTVRFSPCGTFLASGNDSGMIKIWKLHDQAPVQHENDPLLNSNFGGGDDEELVVEQWKMEYSLFGHKGEVYDIAWAPDSKGLVSGSVDHMVCIWDLSTGTDGKIVGQFYNHESFVQ